MHLKAIPTSATILICLITSLFPAIWWLIKRRLFAWLDKERHSFLNSANTASSTVISVHEICALGRVTTSLNSLIPNTVRLRTVFGIRLFLQVSSTCLCNVPDNCPLTVSDYTKNYFIYETRQGSFPGGLLNSHSYSVHCYHFGDKHLSVWLGT